MCVCVCVCVSRTLGHKQKQTKDMRMQEELREMRRMKNELQMAAADNSQAPVLQQQLREMQAKEEAAAKASHRSLAAQASQLQPQALPPDIYIYLYI